MSKHDKPRKEPKLDMDDLENDPRNLYKKKWPKDEQVEELLNEDEDGAEGGEIAGILDHPSYLELERKLTEAEAKTNEYWNQQLRTQAELDNVRRRAERDVSSAHSLHWRNLFLNCFHCR